MSWIVIVAAFGSPREAPLDGLLNKNLNALVAAKHGVIDNRYRYRFAQLARTELENT